MISIDDINSVKVKSDKNHRYLKEMGENSCPATQIISLNLVTVSELHVRAIICSFLLFIWGASANNTVYRSFAMYPIITSAT